MGADLFDELFDVLTKGVSSNYFTSVTQKDYKTDYPYDLYKKDEVVYIEIPIVKANKKDIKIESENDVLRVTYFRPKDETKEYLVHKVAKRDVNLSFKFVPIYDLKNVSAKFEDGLLTIEVRKSKEAEAKKNIVNIL